MFAFSRSCQLNKPDKVSAEACMFLATASLISCGASRHVRRERVATGVEGLPAAATFSARVTPRPPSMFPRTAAGVLGLPSAAARTCSSRLFARRSSVASGAEGLPATVATMPSTLSPARAARALGGVLALHATSARSSGFPLRASLASRAGRVCGSCAAERPNITASDSSTPETYGIAFPVGTTTGKAFRASTLLGQRATWINTIDNIRHGVPCHPNLLTQSLH
ncbi:hypothetical protein MIC448_140011 [Microbacterium sp. C448]|nr:hypothetical protein MIC448_140011 [Microbacterium sp. C448]